MPDKSKTTNWKEDWPSGGEEELLLRYIALLRKEEIETEYAVLCQDTSPLPQTYLLDDKVERMVKKGRKSTAKPRRLQALRRVAMIMLIALATLLAIPTVLFAFSSEFRETIYNYILEWHNGYVDINIIQPTEQDFVKYYVPDYIPEGFELTNIEDDPVSFGLDYEKGNEYIYLYITGLDTPQVMDSEYLKYDFNYQINDCSAIVAQSEDTVILLWNDNVTAFTITTNLSLETALQIANSLTLQKNYP